jgi:retinol dehydrogenase 12
MAQRRSHYSPNDTPTKQGYHVQLGINALGPFLFQTYLTPFCLKTASLPSDPKAATRIIFVSSSGRRASPTPDSIQWDDINPKSATGLRGHALRYGQSKAMNVMHAHELARRYNAQRLVSFSLHPGALTMGLQKNAPGWFNAIFSVLRHPPRFGALTELFAGLAPLAPGEEKMLEEGGRNGGYILPLGGLGDGSPHVFERLAKEGTGERLLGVCEEMVKEWL